MNIQLHRSEKKKKNKQLTPTGFTLIIGTVRRLCVWTLEMKPV